MGNHVRTNQLSPAKPRNNPGIGGWRWELGEGIHPSRFLRPWPGLLLDGGCKVPHFRPGEEARGKEGVPSCYDSSFVLGFAGPLPGMAGASMKGFGGPHLAWLDLVGFATRGPDSARYGRSGGGEWRGGDACARFRVSRAGLLRVAGLAGWVVILVGCSIGDRNGQLNARK